MSLAWNFLKNKYNKKEVSNEYKNKLFLQE